MKGIGNMVSIITASIVCCSALLCVWMVCNTALRIVKAYKTDVDAATLKAAQEKLDEEYAKAESKALNLNNVLEALDNEYGKDEED